MAVRLFVGNMPYGATEADLRAHFSGVGEPSQIVIPVDRETGRPRGFAFVEFLDRPVAEEAINRFNQQPFMGRSLSVSEARPREERPAGGFRPSGGPAVAAASAVLARRRAAASAGPGRGRRLRRLPAAAVLRSAATARRPRTQLRPAQEEERVEREALGEQGARPEGPDQGTLLAAGWAASTTTRTTRRRADHGLRRSGVVAPPKRTRTRSRR